MAVEDFITPEEVEAAPEDPAMAFVQLIGIAEERLNQRRPIDRQHSVLRAMVLGSKARITRAQSDFVSVVVGLAKGFGIEQIASFSPNPPNLSQGDFATFRAMLAQYRVQLMAQSASRNHQGSVQLAPKDKDRIRAHVHAIRDEIDKANLSDSRRSALLKKLEVFEAALDKPRLNLMEATMFAIAILGLPGAVWTSADVVGKLTQNVLSIVAEAKVLDDENHRLPLTEPKVALMPPRQEDFGRKSSGPGGKSLADELDDDIPF